MSAETITLLNFIVHSLVIGAAAWLLVRFVIRDAMRRCILANLAVLMCLYSPFDISMRDLFPPQQPVPVWTPLRETFEADWRVTVTPVTRPVVMAAAPAPSWDVNDVVRSLRWLAWLVTAVLLLRLLIQSIRVQCWAWRLRDLTQAEIDSLPKDVRFERMSVFEGDGTPCVAGWFFPVIAVSSTAFEKLTPQQWHWLIRHESEHLRCHDTVAVLLQNIVRAFLWWNPFIHALIEEYARAREEACDAAAVGENRDQSDYADFLLAWAAKAAPQPSCVMPIAHSRPARRLKARLVALMEARGVRKRLGALFVLGCATFAVLAPFFAASFGIVTVAAQEAAKADPKDKTMFVRTYRVAPDFLSRSQELRDPFAIQDQKAPVVSKQSTERITARQVLEKHGITFPPDASAVFNPSTSQLIVRNTLANIALADSVIDDLSIQFPQVYLTCQMISADRHYGVHGSVLSGDEAKALIQSVSQKKDIHLLAAPRVTTKFGQRAGIEIVREVLPKVLPDGSLSGDMKLLGPRVFIDMSRPEKGKTTLAAEVEFGINPTSEDPWSLKNAAQADWDKVMLHKIAGQAALASGETLLLHLETSKKPLTVLLTAQALDPSGKEISSFDGVRPGASARSQIVAAAAADKQASEWAVRVYQVPAGFAQDKPPIEVLKAAGIAFPKAADAMLKDGNLTVRNTKANLKLIEAWIDALNKVEVKKSVHLSVLAAEMKGDFLKLLNDWLPPLPGAAKNTEAPNVITEPPSPEVLRQFILSGIFTQPQFENVVKSLADSGAKLESLKPNPNPQMYVLPAAVGGQEMKIEPIIGPDGNTIELIIRTPAQDQNPARGISTAVTIWDGQTVVLGSQASEGVSRFLFITGNLIEKRSGKK
jgi:beta-lactamase regulating signal transducer with metallopeptidase domain